MEGTTILDQNMIHTHNKKIMSIFIVATLIIHRSSTEWRYSKNLVNEKRLQSAPLHSGEHWVHSFVAVSAEDSPNQAGRVFTSDEFQTLLTSEWTKESGVCLADWLIESFLAKTFLLGQSRSVEDRADEPLPRRRTPEHQDGGREV